MLLDLKLNKNTEISLVNWSPTSLAILQPYSYAQQAYFTHLFPPNISFWCNIWMHVI